LLFESLAYFVAFRVYLLQKRQFGDVIDASGRWSVIAAAAAGAALGSKLLALCEDPRATLAHLHDPMFLLGGKTIVGGLAGGWIAVELAKKTLGITRRTGDLFAVPICIGTAIGRIGCFLSGLEDNTYGTPTSLPWGHDFGDGIARHPVQLYEAVLMVALAFLLQRAMHRLAGSGRVFRMALLGYGLVRIGLDFLKPYPRFFGMGTLQWAALAIALYCAATLLSSRPHPELAPRVAEEAVH
jgi:prolipoprotein diacylglyceryltransferase